MALEVAAAVAASVVVRLLRVAVCWHSADCDDCAETPEAMYEEMVSVLMSASDSYLSWCRLQ